jgi:hypothetical protein
MKVFLICKYNVFFGILLFLTTTNCTTSSPEFSEVNYVILDEFETVISNEEMLLYSPTVLTFGEDGFFVFDDAVGHVLSFDINGSLTGEFGRRGQGPGEFSLLNNIFINDDFIYFVDVGQFLIHKYSKNGEHIFSLDYGAMGYFPSPSPPMITGVIMARDLIHQPLVTLQGNVMLSPFLSSGEELPINIYHLANQKEEIISTIGNLPEGSTREVNTIDLRNAISNGEIPTHDYTNVFPVNDLANPDEYFFVYTAFPKIEKYTDTGEKLWTSEIYSLPELDEVTERFHNIINELNRESWIPLNKYMSGVSSPSGDLYLATNTNPEMPGTLWIHRYNSGGELMVRYKLKSDINIPPVFDIDHKNRRIFVITEEADVRAYPF